MGGGSTLVTDHKPLTAILGPKKGVPSLAAARLQCWAVLFSAYKYDIKFKSTQAHANADGFVKIAAHHSEGGTIVLVMDVIHHKMAREGSVKLTMIKDDHLLIRRYVSRARLKVRPEQCFRELVCDGRTQPHT